MIIVESKRAMYLGSAASIIEDGRELAWAERYVSKQPDIKWILGNFVEADHHNSNGHYFPLADLEQFAPTIAHKPLNMCHHEHQIVGCFVGQELLKPGAEAAGAGVDHPHVEALSAFWKNYFQDLYDQVVLPAHKAGSLYYSMEAVPSTVTCMGGPGGLSGACDREFPYAGPQSPTYCDHLNLPGAWKRLNKPQFTAGALIVPPVRPGWKRADITELSALIEQNIEEAVVAHDQIATEFPHLNPKEWEGMMAQLLVQAHPEGPAGDPVFKAYLTVGEKGPAKEEMSPTGATPARPATSMPDGTFNIFDEGTLRSAINIAKSVGVGGPDEDAREHILRRADALGLMNLVGESETLAAWRTMYPDWKTSEPLGVENAALASLGFGAFSDYGIEYEVARDFTQARRLELAKKKLAMSDGSYPIVTVADLKRAVEGFGHAPEGERAALMTWTKARADALGATSVLPDAWK